MQEVKRERGNTAAAVQMNKPGFCEALSACCCHVTHEELNVMPKGRVCTFDKVGCLPPTWCFEAQQEQGQLLKASWQQLLSHCCCCHWFSGEDDSTQRALPHGFQR